MLSVLSFLYSKLLNLVLLRFSCLSFQRPVICFLNGFSRDWLWLEHSQKEIFNLKDIIFKGSYQKHTKNMTEQISRQYYCVSILWALNSISYCPSKWEAHAILSTQLPFYPAPPFLHCQTVKLKMQHPTPWLPQRDFQAFLRNKIIFPCNL